jgi:hypothetical protein
MKTLTIDKLNDAILEHYSSPEAFCDRTNLGFTRTAEPVTWDQVRAVIAERDQYLGLIQQHNALMAELRGGVHSIIIPEKT